MTNLIEGRFYLLFGFKYYIELSTRPDDSMGSDEDWEKATEALKNALTEKNLDFKPNDIHFKNSIYFNE